MLKRNSRGLLQICKDKLLRNKKSIEIRIDNFFNLDTKPNNNYFTNKEFHNATKNLYFTVFWVDKLITNHNFSALDQSRVLRKTNPTFKGKQLHVNLDFYQEIDLDIELYKNEEFNQIIRKILPARKISVNEKVVLTEKGRILGFEIGLTTHDGVSNDQSNGFIDSYDIPPIDTWFFVKSKFNSSQNGILFCWIPNEAEKIMQDAIDVEIFDSYFWLDERYPKMQIEIEKRIATFIQNSKII